MIKVVYVRFSTVFTPNHASTWNSIQWIHHLGVLLYIKRWVIWTNIIYSHEFQRKYEFLINIGKCNEIYFFIFLQRVSI